MPVFALVAVFIPALAEAAQVLLNCTPLLQAEPVLPYVLGPWSESSFTAAVDGTSSPGAFVRASGLSPH